MNRSLENPWQRRHLACLLGGCARPGGLSCGGAQDGRVPSNAFSSNVAPLRGLKNSLAVLLFLFCTSRVSHAQFDPLVSPREAPQARSAQELDEYLEILASPSDRERVSAV